MPLTLSRNFNQVTIIDISIIFVKDKFGSEIIHILIAQLSATTFRVKPHFHKSYRLLLLIVDINTN